MSQASLNCPKSGLFDNWIVGNPDYSGFRTFTVRIIISDRFRSLLSGRNRLRLKRTRKRKISGKFSKLNPLSSSQNRSSPSPSLSPNLSLENPSPSLSHGNPNQTLSLENWTAPTSLKSLNPRLSLGDPTASLSLENPSLGIKTRIAKKKQKNPNQNARKGKRKRKNSFPQLTWTR